jgi:phospholipid transport system substrate-binding protein
MVIFLKKTFRSFFFILLIGFANLCFAAASSPIDTLQTTSDQMISELNANKTTMKSNPKKVFDIVHRILLPHVDMNTMSKSVIGRNDWNSATVSEQQQFKDQFTDLLIRTYATALASYTNQKVEFFPSRESYAGQTQIQVQSQIVQPGGPPIPVTYQLLLEGSQWKVIDFSVDNVSIVQNYRAQFANDLSQGGLKYLVNKLSQHNDKFTAR